MTQPPGAMWKLRWKHVLATDTPEARAQSFDDGEGWNGSTTLTAIVHAGAVLAEE